MTSGMDLLKVLHVAVPFRDLKEKYLDLLLENGVSPEIGITAEVLERFSREEFREVAALFSERGLRTTLHAPFMDLHPASSDSIIRTGSRSRLLETFELIPVFRPRSVVCHLGFDPRLHEEEIGEWVDRWVEFWTMGRERVEKYGVPIMLENTFEWDPGVFERIFRAVSSPLLGFCFDTGHCLAFGKVSWRDWLDRTRGRLGQLHLHDNSGGFDDHRAVGEGRFPFRDLFRYLSEAGIRPIVTLEAHREEWVWTSLQNLREMWPWDASFPLS